jgi:hypothetical protein
MKTKKLFYLLVSLSFMVLFIPSFGWAQPKTEEKAPVITHSFAVEKGQYGIYLEDLYRGRGQRCRYV